MNKILYPMMAIMLSSCCNDLPDFIDEYEYHNNTVIIPQKEANFKIYMDVTHVEGFASDELGHSLKSEIVHKANYGDSVTFNFYIRKSFYKGNKIDSKIDSILNIRSKGDTIQVYFDFRAIDTVDNNSDYEMLGKSCACSPIDPYVLIDSVAIECDMDKEFTITEGYWN